MSSPQLISHDGPVPYQLAWDEQRRLHAARVAGQIPDTVVLLEHEPVYTAGKRTEAHERPLLDAGAPVIDVDRGGKITWHGPGQLVGYPIVRLPDPIDVIAFVRRVEQVLIDVCAEFGVIAGRVEIKGRSGVWIPADGRGPDRKLGAIGLRVAQGVSMHGFALNCECDLSWFDRIVPCGIADASVTSLSAELGRRVRVSEVRPVVERHLPGLLTAPVAAAAAGPAA
ncbi:MAG TPA: lipoyl(octanoyl) transferase LipB [Jiangellaceae bacterium]|nr:lipoyl(octanoyl) transferase LipB [Jiangellaceae bacterium]